MRVAKAVGLWIVVCLSIPGIVQAEQSRGPSKEEFLASLSTEIAPGLGEGGVPPAINLTCTSTAWCASSSTSVACTAASGTCAAGVDQYCPGGIRGYAECNGVRTYCPACPSTCNPKACSLACGGPGLGVCSGNNCICI